MIETLGSLALQAGHDLGDLRSDSLENPRTPLSRVFDSTPSYTGKNVSEISSLQISAVWACVRILSGAVAKTPFLTYRRVDGSGKHLAPDHYLYSILKQSANPFMSAFRFKRLMQTWVLLWGNAYAEMEINGRGQITALWPWRPDRTRVTVIGNDLVYTYQMDSGETVSRPSSLMFHLRGLEVDGFMGLSPIAQARQSLGLALAAEEFGAKFFGNNGRPGMVLKHPGKLSDLARKNLIEGWEAMHKGLQGSHRMGVLEEGMEIQEISIPPEDAQFLVTRKFQISEIARWYGVPLHKLAELDKATNNNIEHQGLEFVQDSCADWFSNWEQECEHTMLSQRERGSIVLGFDPSNLTKGDFKSTAEGLAIARQNGFVNADEGREKLGMNPIGEEAGGQKYIVQLNMQELNKVGTAADPNTAPKPAAIEPASSRMLESTGVSQEN